MQAFDFYPRSPCGERHTPIVIMWGSILFLSTLSLRRATMAGVPAKADRVYFYPRSPCGERPVTARIIDPTYRFLSTLSLRRATAVQNTKIDELNDFYPRSPCGERQTQVPNPTRQNQFLSTLSLRRATNPKIRLSLTIMISIHALLAESDRRGAVPVILII